MSVLFMDSFDHYATDDILGKHYASNVSQVSIDMANARTGRAGLLVSGASTAQEGPPEPGKGLVTRPRSIFWGDDQYLGAGSTVICVAIKATNAPASKRVAIKTWAEAQPNDWQAELRITPSSNFEVWTKQFPRGDFTASPVVTIFDGNWHYLEWAVRGNSTLDIQLWYDGTKIIDSGTEPFPVTPSEGTYFQLLDFSGNAASWYDDLVLVERGDNPLNGQPRVHVIKPNGAGASNAWTATPGAGSDYEEIDETEPDFDATYLQSSASDQQHLSEYEDLDLDDPTILAAQQVDMIAYTGSGEDVIRFLRRDSGGPTTVGPVIDVTGVSIPPIDWDFQLVAAEQTYGCALKVTQGATWSDQADFNDDQWGLEAE